MGLSTSNFLTCSFWAVDTVIAEVRAATVPLHKPNAALKSSQSPYAANVVRLFGHHNRRFFAGARVAAVAGAVLRETAAPASAAAELRG